MPRYTNTILTTAFFILVLFSIAFCESITITTYYPSPYGSYNELTTTGKTCLATTSGNNVGIGTSNPLEKLVVGIDIGAVVLGDGIAIGDSGASNKPGVHMGEDSNNRGWIIWKSATNDTSLGNIVGGVTYDDTLVIKSGNVLVGTPTNPASYRLVCNGVPAANGVTAWTNYSDSRLKENIKGIEDGTLDKIMQLRPTTFNYNEKYYEVTGYNRDREGRKLCGFVAQEMVEVFPDMVNKGELARGAYLDTNLTNLQVYLVKAIQEQQKEIESLKSEVNNLRSKLNAG